MKSQTNSIEVATFRSTTQTSGHADFERETIAVLSSLKNAISCVLIHLGGIRRPTDLEHLLQLDRTLAWQLIKVSETETPLENATIIPSLVSMERFAKAAIRLGVPAEQTESMLDSCREFENLVKRQAGGRVCFNSMVSAATMDDDWHATERQHRRNIFRGASHMTGTQAGVMCSTVIHRRGDRPQFCESLMLSGFVDLRVLWKIDAINVYRSRFSSRALGADFRKGMQREPIFKERGTTGYLLSEFCTGPSPNVRISDGADGWILGDLLNAEIGIPGESTVLFGSCYRNVPYPALTDRYIASQSQIYIPVKLVMIDLLIEPGLFPGWLPSACVRVGTSMTDQVAPGSEERTLPTRVELERIGTGPALIKEFPRYSEAVQTTCSQAGWNIKNYENWRLRLEFPLFQSMIRAQLSHPDLLSK
ncbi:MAG TPA: hypothetical protein VNQ76_16440 [Planctomicrobium sp.]|nr:hypothetical protein [Planctomicrobium sp.]